MSGVDEVRQRTDIVDVIGQYVKLTKAGRNFHALCPFHTETRPSFIVNPERQSWHCFGSCSTGGDVFSFIMKKEGIDFSGALTLLAQRAGVTLPAHPERDARKGEKDRLYQLNEAAARYYNELLVNSPSGKKALDYVTARGLSARAVSDFQLGFSPNVWDALKQHLAEKGYNENEMVAAGLVAVTAEGRSHDQFRGRLMFPIHDDRGRTTGFGARALDDSQPKYFNSPQTLIFDKSGTLYGIDLAAPFIRRKEMVVLVEGYMDVIMAHQGGFQNVVAAMGTSITEKQVLALKKLTRNLVLALDPDSAGLEAMLRCIGYENTLEAEVRVVVLPSGQDPDEVIRADGKAWEQLVGAAIPVVDYAFDTTAAKLDLTTARDKSALVERLLPVIVEMKDMTRQGHYLQKMSRLVGVSERRLEASLGEMRDARTKKSPWPSKKQGAPAENPSGRRIFSNPLEESCLAFILRHPELRGRSQEIAPEYFENSENREVYLAWREAEDVTGLRDRLASTMQEHLDILLNREILDTQIEQRFADYVLRLRENYLRSLVVEKEAAFALEAQESSSSSEFAKLQQQSAELNNQLNTVFTQKAKRAGEQRR